MKRLCNFQILFKKSLIAPSIVTVVCIEMKWVFLDAKFTTAITTLKSTDFRSSTMKSTLMVSHLASGIRSKYGFLRDRWHASLVHKQRS